MKSQMLCQRSSPPEGLSFWDFAETFSVDEVLSLILGVNDHQSKSWEEKKAPYVRMASAFEQAHQQILHAYLDADIPFEGEPKYEIPKFDPLNLHSQLVQQARNNPTTENARLASGEKFQDAHFSRTEIHRWLKSIGAKSVYQFGSDADVKGHQDVGADSESDKFPSPGEIKEKTSHLNIIGALLELIQSPRPGRDSAAAVIRELLENYPEKQGISKRNLEKVFGQAKESLKD